jgi:central kinetochore subunit Mis15/CHL4
LATHTDELEEPNDTRADRWRHSTPILASFILTMGPRPSIRAPTTASISNAYKVPSATCSLVKSLSRLPRSSLIDLALKWLDDENQATCAPYLACNRNLEEEAEEDYLHTPAESIEELRNLYQAFKTEPGTKRDIVDRILDGDWRRGISLQQLAMVDFQHLQDNEASLRWTALKLVPISAASKEAAPEHLKRPRNAQDSEPFPCMHPSAFIRALQHEISPIVKAHYYLHRLPVPHSLTILRLHVADTPYANPTSSTQSHFTDSARTLYIAFPDSCPYIYVALSGSGGGGAGNNKGAAVSRVDTTALKRTVLEAVPKALSRPQQRYALEATALTAKNLSTMCTLRGNGRSGASQGAYSIFADGSAEGGPAEVVRSSFESKVSAIDEIDEEVEPQGNKGQATLGRKRRALGERDPNLPTETVEDRKQTKKRKMEVARRFGTTGLPDAKYRAPIDRLHIKLEADLDRPQDEDLDTTSEVDTNARTQSSTTSRAKRKKGTVLDTFNPQKNRSELQPQAPTNYLAQYRSSPQSATTQTPRAPITLTFHGTDVFAGIRTLAEMGFVDLARMPAWMTGEEGVSTATICDGAVVEGRGGGA